MNLLPDLDPPRPPSFGIPRPTFASPLAQTALPLSGPTDALGQQLAELLETETALYVLTREWRHQAANRKFLRLQILLEEQFSELGVRLTRLATRQRDLGFTPAPSRRSRSTAPPPVLGAGGHQVYMLRHLLDLHESMGDRLHCVGLPATGPFSDRETNTLLAALAAQHEKDAFMLRALLWEVENLTP